MKIGILTFHRSLNNGALMQCYSLYMRIKKDFPSCEVEVIDYDMPILATIYPMNILDYYKYSRSIRETVSKTIHIIQDPLILKRFREKRVLFNESLKNIKLSEQRIVSNGTEELFSYINRNYDVVIVGSDAIWNYSLRGFPNPYFLDTSIKIPMLSYAASCYGMNYERMPNKEKNTIKAILSQYAFIGVRDVESERMFEYLECSNQCVHTCDPTIFLEIDKLPVDEDVIKNKLEKCGYDFSKRTVGLMLSEKQSKIVRDLMGESFQYVSLFNYSKYADINLYDINPFEWAAIFKYFDITFTTYFHGTLLSLKNLTPVIALALENEFNSTHISKVEDVLKRLGLSELYYSASDSNQNLIKEKANDLIVNFDKNRLFQSINTEMESYQIFKRKLESIVNS